MHRSTGTFYDRVSILYPFINFFLAGHRKRLIEEVNGQPPGLVLEVGVGMGSHLDLYVSHQITGIDISKKMLQRAQRFKRPDIRLMLMNGEATNFDDDSFDYVVMAHVLAVAGNADAMLREAHRVLKPGGRLFVLNHFTPDNLLGWLDRAFQPVSSLLHFKSSFHLQAIRGFDQFNLIKQIGLGPGCYFKLLIFSKG